MKKYRIEMSAIKAFYVEADSQEAALEHWATQDEQSPSMGDVDWEFDEAKAIERNDQEVEAAEKIGYRLFK